MPQPKNLKDQADPPVPAINNEYVSTIDEKLIKLDQQKEPEFFRDALQYF